MFSRNRARSSVLALCVAALVAAIVLPTGSAGASHTEAEASLHDADGRLVGVVRLTESRGSVTVRATVRGQSPGFHGFHVHGTGECVPPFTSAGGHFNPGGAGHGAHAGDLPSLLVSENGTATLTFVTDRFRLTDLFDADGSAVIVHQAPDNFANIPDRYHSHQEDVFGPDSATLATGDAGGRAACGVVRR
jgi:Cu-Zn family superoxide dismutase